MIRRGWVLLLAFGASVALAGCVILDNELAMNELTEGDLRLMCEQYDHAVVACDGGWQAGFASLQECVDTFTRFKEDNRYSYTGPDCDGITVGEARACLNLAPCERPEAELCQEIYACVKKYHAEDQGIEFD